MIVEIKISELVKGHFVVDIVKQRGTFSLTNSGHIKNTKVIDNLRSKGVESILVDTNKTLTFDENGQVISATEETSPNKESKNSPIILEITKAKKLFNESKNIQRQVFSDAQQGRALNLTPVIEITNKL